MGQKDQIAVGPAGRTSTAGTVPAEPGGGNDTTGVQQFGAQLPSRSEKPMTPALATS